jgi:hypothetical protein
MDLLVEGLVAGTRTLAEAVPETAALQDDAGTIDHMRFAFGGQSNDEVLARHLLVRVSSRLAHSPEQYNQVLPRLEAEFKELYPLASMPVVNRNRLWMGHHRDGGTASSSSDAADARLH